MTLKGQNGSKWELIIRSHMGYISWLLGLLFYLCLAFLAVHPFMRRVSEIVLGLPIHIYRGIGMWWHGHVVAWACGGMGMWWHGHVVAWASGGMGMWWHEHVVSW